MRIKLIFLSLEMFIDIITKHKETLDEEDVRDFIDAFLVEANRNSSETFTVIFERRFRYHNKMSEKDSKQKVYYK